MAEVRHEVEVDFGIDELRMYFGEDYKINDYITIKQPTIGQILEFGEQKMYASIMPFTCNTTSYRLQLWDMGIDWNKISDFELFAMLVRTLTPDVTSLMFGDVDFTKFIPYKRINNIFDDDGNPIPQSEENEGELVLVYSDDIDFQIDELIYLHMREYIRMMFDQHPKAEFTKGKTAKEWIIEEDREKLEQEQMKNKNKGKYKSFLLPLVSSMLNHPGFKYKKNELKECGIVEFMDSIKRLQTYESVRALMSGMYSGMLDTSKMDLNKELNWLRDLHE